MQSYYQANLRFSFFGSANISKTTHNIHFIWKLQVIPHISLFDFYFDSNASLIFLVVYPGSAIANLYYRKHRPSDNDSLAAPLLRSGWMY